MKKLPYRINNYEELVNDNYYYVDKTMYIEQLEGLVEERIMLDLCRGEKRLEILKKTVADEKLGKTELSKYTVFAVNDEIYVEKI